MSDQASVSGQVYKGFGTIFKLLTFVFVIAGALLLARVVFLFFGSLKTVPGYEAIISFTDILVKPLAMVDPIKTPYEGIFDIAATGVLLLVMIIEFMISQFEGYLQQKSLDARTRAARAVAPKAPAAVEVESEEPIARK